MADLTDQQREELLDAAEALQTAAEEFAQAIRRAGERDSDVLVIRRFASYHLADLEGEGHGWLGGPHLIDELRSLQESGFRDEPEEGDEPEGFDPAGWCGTHYRMACPLHADDEEEQS